MTRIKVKKVEDEDIDVIDVGYSHIRVILSLFRQDKLESSVFLTPEEAFDVASGLIACAKLAKANRKS
jgi:virulence-associated protein VapD